jgi:hypothetical protein
MRLLRFVGAVVIISIVGTQSTFAAEWRFCVAPSDREHRAYLTNPFLTSASLTSASMDILERNFDELLDRWGRSRDSVQCPLGRMNKLSIICLST